MPNKLLINVNLIIQGRRSYNGSLREIALLPSTSPIMITSQKSPFESKLDSLIQKCYIKVYCYQFLGIAIAFNTSAIHICLAINFTDGNRSLLESPTLWFISTASIMSVLAISWTRQQTQFAHQERLYWERAIDLYHQNYHPPVESDQQP